MAPLFVTEHLQQVPLSRSVHEDPTSFERVYGLYRGRIYRLCLHMTRNPTEAEDLTQDVFLQAFQKMNQFEGRATFFTWLHRVAVNVVLMRLRKRSHRMVSLEETLSPEHQDHRSQVLVTPDARLAGTIERVLLTQAVVHLPARYRLAFTLHDCRGLPAQGNSVAPEVVGRQPKRDLTQFTTISANRNESKKA